MTSGIPRKNINNSLGMMIAFGIVLIVSSVVNVRAEIEDDPQGGARQMAHPGVPNGKDTMPGDFEAVNRYVTGMSIVVDATNVKKYNSDDKNNVSLSIRGQGPIPWSFSKFSSGNISPRLNPRFPWSQENLGKTFGIHGFTSKDQFDKSGQAWHPQIDHGVVLSTVAKNGEQWQDGTPMFYGVTAISINSSGPGYSIADKHYKQLGFGQSIDIITGKAGSQGKANINVAAAWFPYGGNWLGGYFRAASEPGKDAEWHSENSFNMKALPKQAKETLTWRFHQKSLQSASLQLPNIDANRDGMLFCVATASGDNNANLCNVAVKNGAKHWTLQLHEDDSYSNGESAHKISSVNASKSDFAFVYIPFGKIFNLHGGHVGKDGKFIRTDVNNKMNVTRISQGTYRVSMDGMSDQSGMLLLQSVGFAQYVNSEEEDATSKVFLSYEYRNSARDFLVQAHYVKTKDIEIGLTDTEFYIAWVDFHSPFLWNEMITQDLKSQDDGAVSFVWGFLIGTLVAIVFGVLFAIIMRNKILQTLAGPKVRMQESGETKLEMQKTIPPASTSATDPDIGEEEVKEEETDVQSV